MKSRGEMIFGTCFFAACASIGVDATLNLNLIPWWQSASAARFLSGLFAFMLAMMTLYSIIRPKLFWRSNEQQPDDTTSANG